MKTIKQQPETAVRLTVPKIGAFPDSKDRIILYSTASRSREENLDNALYAVAVLFALPRECVSQEKIREWGGEITFYYEG